MVMAPLPSVTARRFTVDEVLSWPDDGNGYEVVDGVLLVTDPEVIAEEIIEDLWAAMEELEQLQTGLAESNPSWQDAP